LSLGCTKSFSIGSIGIEGSFLSGRFDGTYRIYLLLNELVEDFLLIGLVELAAAEAIGM